VDTPERLRLLAVPFPAEAVGWKAQTVKGERALAVAYIDARDVMDRLDAAVGPAGWQDVYVFHPDGTVRCRLSLRLDGEWITKEDVGGPSEQPDEGDKVKAAVSDALKRAAVKWGIGRYLYRLEAVWCDYDPQRKQLRGTPPLPAWALPAVTAKPTPKPPKLPKLPVPAPVDGAELEARLKRTDEMAAAKGLCAAGDLLDHVRTLGVKEGAPPELVRWAGSRLAWGIAQAQAFVSKCQAGQGPVHASGGPAP
jgi:hypothetical protein